MSITQDLTVCIRSLQFHDRLIQQLAVVRNLLTTLADHPIPDVTGFGAQRWAELLATLRQRLTQDSHHRQFDRLLRTGDITHGGSPDAEFEGSIELF